MAEQEQAKRRERPEHEGTEQEEEISVLESEAEQIDDLLDEIDSVLEENAEEFVKNYVQKGGE